MALINEFWFSDQNSDFSLSYDVIYIFGNVVVKIIAYDSHRVPPDTWLSNGFFTSPTINNLPFSKPPNKLVEPRYALHRFSFDIILIFRINVREIKNQIYAVVIDYNSKPVLGRQLANIKMKCLLNQIHFPYTIDPLLSIIAIISTPALTFSSSSYTGADRLMSTQQTLALVGSYSRYSGWLTALFCHQLVSLQLLTL